MYFTSTFCNKLRGWKTCFTFCRLLLCFLLDPTPYYSTFLRIFVLRFVDNLSGSVELTSDCHNPILCWRFQASTTVRRCCGSCFSVWRHRVDVNCRHTANVPEVLSLLFPSSRRRYQLSSAWRTIAGCLNFTQPTGTTSKMIVFWDFALFGLLEIDRRFTGSPFTHRPDDGGSKHLWNVGKLLPDYMAQHPRRQPSCSPTVLSPL
jgi:hypothetical protein